MAISKQPKNFTGENFIKRTESLFQRFVSAKLGIRIINYS